ADRMLCYASFPIRMQLEQKLKDIHEGKAKPMDYGLLPIYVVSFVNFAIEHRDEDILQEGLISRYCICSPRTGEMMTDSLQFVYLELGRLKAKLGEANQCKSLVEQLAYSLKYMRELEECPKPFEDKLFSLLFQASEYANLDVRKQMQVSEIMRTELDRIAENNYAREQGLKQGLAEGKAEGKAEEKKITAKNLRELKVDPAIIAKATGLSVEEILAL
ncbi:MAG: PD-(D/E)XK nuclease family transposase, partial [Bacteroidales bacterium]|nr:PD-(D/E)XK nuclease family transposase [Bacteroidales bacterium]